MIRLVCLLALFGLTIAGPVVHTKSGPVEGYDDGGVSIWRGIPFGAPPVGDLRFRAPRAAAPWNTTKKCQLQKPICPQFRITKDLFLGSEDCLYLNVYVPKKATGPLPVMFWIFGGGYSIGDGWEFGLYDGKNLALKRDVIVVTPNYRLASLGFMALDELRREDPSNSTGNYALQDQVLALEWVRDNIAAFGGDPNQVTIFGESAGAFSVCWHLVSPQSKGLFRAAIMQSGTCDSPQFFRTYDDATTWSKIFAKMVGCDPEKPGVVQCLRNVPTGVIIGSMLGNITRPDGRLPRLYPIMPWGIAIDGTQRGLIDVPQNLINAGKWAKVPLLAGTNKDEGTIFILAVPLVVPGTLLPLNEKTFNTTIKYFFGDNPSVMNNISLYYPRQQYKSHDEMASHILRDYFFACAARRTLDAVTRQKVSGWMYRYVYDGHFVEDIILGDYHAAELEYVWDNPWPPIIHIWNAKDHKMADVFGTYWSNLAKHMSPNGNSSQVTSAWTGAAQPQWPSWDGNSNMLMELDVPPYPAIEKFGSVCTNFWDKVEAQY